jgi:hypothetical protein
LSISSDSESDEVPRRRGEPDEEGGASGARARSATASSGSSGSAGRGASSRDAPRSAGPGAASAAATRRRGEDAFGVVQALGPKQKDRPRALVGLANLGNTCFMNSCLQCLSNTPELSGVFASGAFERELDPKSKSRELTLNYAQLMQDMWRGGGKGGQVCIQPSALKMQISRWARQFSGYNQHDAQELLRFLLDGLQEGLMRPKRELPFSFDDDAFDDRPVPEQAHRMWQNYLARNDSLITEVFCGQLHSRVVCSRCRRESNCYDPFMDLSLPIPRGGGLKGGMFGGGECSLEQCLAAFVEEERLSGMDEYYCAKCKKHQEATKSMRLFRLPRVLVVHLKRFDKRFSRSKINTTVRFVPPPPLTIHPVPSSRERPAGSPSPTSTLRPSPRPRRPSGTARSTSSAASHTTREAPRAGTTSRTAATTTTARGTASTTGVSRPSRGRPSTAPRTCSSTCAAARDPHAAACPISTE